MTRSDDAACFFAAVYEAIQEIPHGRVTTYGHIADLIGRPECPRQVGTCLKHLPSPQDAAASGSVYHNQTVPWQRVINSKGTISARSQASGAAHQAAMLRQEGVQVERTSIGEYTVDFKEYGWFPPVLPSETSDEETQLQ